MSLNGKRRRRVLAIDEEPATAEWLQQVIEAEGYEVRAALSGEAGEDLFRHWRPDVVLTGLTLPDIDGIQLLKQLREIDPQPETIVIGGEGTIHRAVEAGRAGAFFFIEKPVLHEGLVDLLHQAATRTEERAEHQHLREQIRGQYSFSNVIGQSRVMKDLFELIDRVAVSAQDKLATCERADEDQQRRLRQVKVG